MSREFKSLPLLPPPPKCIVSFYTHRGMLYLPVIRNAIHIDMYLLYTYCNRNNAGKQVFLNMMFTFYWIFLLMLSN